MSHLAWAIQDSAMSPLCKSLTHTGHSKGENTWNY